MNYYNEIDPYAARWLRNLIAAGHLPDGIVDERSIEDVKPDELTPYTQCHFFAGIGIWALSLRNSGWPDDRPVWTGSCPCQPFSAAGKGAGFSDERHLWPAWFHLIEQCRPPVVLGEQVASGDAAHWIDLVQTDMEAVDYAFGAIPFPSAGVGAPHIRDRLYFVADRVSTGLEGRDQGAMGDERKAAERSRGAGGVADDDARRQRFASLRVRGSDIYDTDGRCPVNGAWADAEWVYCRDKKWRAVEPGTFPLAHGATSRVGRLRAYGNAINAEAARVFISAYLGTTLTQP